MSLPTTAINYPSSKLKNWAGNMEYSTQNILHLKNVKDIQEQVKNIDNCKTLGSRHCFNSIADSQNMFLDISQMKGVLSLDKKHKRVTVEGGIKYGELSPFLHRNGFALPNLASLPHISVVGGCITATHGSGTKNGNLATAVSGLELIAADGTIHHLSKQKDKEFLGAVVNLGALGVITKITLDLVPTFDIKQFVYEDLPFQQLTNNFDKILGAAYSVSLFTDWKTDSINEVWLKTLSSEPMKEEWNSAFFGARAAIQNLHPIGGISAENCSEQMGIQGPWFERLPHFKMGFTPSSGKELQSEYFIPKQHGLEAICAISKLSSKISPHLFISEIRSIASDDLWMSPCYHQDSIAIHFTWKPDWPAVNKLLPLIEKELEPYNAKPHWGKLFTMKPHLLQKRYERLSDFKNLINRFDPNGKFRNKYLDENLFSSIK